MDFPPGALRADGTRQNPERDRDMNHDSLRCCSKGSKEPYKRAIGPLICPMLDLQWSASRWPFNNFFQFRSWVLGLPARNDAATRVLY